MAADTIMVPRPAPDEMVIAICGEDDARAWIKCSKTLFADTDFTIQLPELLAEAQQQLREKLVA